MDNRNSPAYPIFLNPGENMPEGIGADGITKREYFAGLAMQGLATNGVRDWRVIPEAAVKMADMLLAQLEKSAGE